MTDERCKHELIVGQCADCRPQVNSNTATTVKIFSIPAKFNGQCAYCLSPIKINEPISRDPDLSWSHTDCIIRDTE